MQFGPNPRLAFSSPAAALPSSVEASSPVTAMFPGPSAWFAKQRGRCRYWFASRLRLRLEVNPEWSPCRSPGFDVLRYPIASAIPASKGRWPPTVICTIPRNYLLLSAGVYKKIKRSSSKVGIA